MFVRKYIISTFKVNSGKKITASKNRKARLIIIYEQLNFSVIVQLLSMPRNLVLIQPCPRYKSTELLKCFRKI